MKNSEAPGAANRSNPKRARRIPSTKTSHQGRVSPLLPADILTLHLPRLLLHQVVPIIGTQPSPRPVFLNNMHPLLLAPIHERRGRSVLGSSHTGYCIAPALWHVLPSRPGEALLSDNAPRKGHARRRSWLALGPEPSVVGT